MSKRIIIDVESYPIKPGDIDTEHPFWEGFGRLEKEVAAGWIVSFCQKQGSWRKFPLASLETFYNQYGHKDFQFAGLDTDGYVIVEDGFCRVTHDFVAKCFGSSPRIPSVL